MKTGIAQTWKKYLSNSIWIGLILMSLSITSNSQYKQQVLPTLVGEVRNTTLWMKNGKARDKNCKNIGLIKFYGYELWKALAVKSVSERTNPNR